MSIGAGGTKDHDHRAFSQSVGVARSPNGQLRDGEGRESAQSLLGGCQSTLECRGEQVGRVEQAILDALIGQRLILLEHTPAEPSQGGRQGNRDPEKQDQQVSGRPKPRTDRH